MGTTNDGNVHCTDVSGHPFGEPKSTQYTYPNSPSRPGGICAFVRGKM
jgi:hypothetical protein